MNHRSLPSVRVHDSLFLSPKSEKFIFLVVIGYETGSNFVAFATQLWRPLSWSLRPSYLTGLGPWTSMDSASKSLELACSLGLVLIHASAITMRTCPDKPAGEWETCEAKLSHPRSSSQNSQLTSRPWREPSQCQHIGHLLDMWVRDASCCLATEVLRWGSAMQ